MRRVILANVLGWFVLTAGDARAHGPFDHSSRLIVRDAQLELVVTMGADATREFLSRAGLASNTTAVLSRTTSRSPYGLPMEVASKLFEASLGGEPLAAGNVSVMTEGLETLFTVIFPRPDGGTLNLRAFYFNGIEPMKGGVFIAHDENLRQFGEALLSRASNSVQITLPAKVGAEGNGEPVAAADIGSIEPAVRNQKPDLKPAPVSQPRFGEFRKPDARFGLIAVGTAMIALLAALCLRLRRWSSP